MEQKFIDKAEEEAQEKAIKQIANMLTRSDQLDKVEQYRRRVARSKASVEARLKAAVQSQLDGVKTGLNQMNQALQEVKEIKESMADVNRMYTSVGTLSVQMRDIKDVTSQHSQLATAMENLKHIFEVPEEVEKAREMIRDGKLLLAHKVLTDLEGSRDDLLYEQHKLDNHSEADVRQLQTYFAEAEKLSTELGAQLWRVLAKTSTTIRKDPSVITTALRIVEREERTDMKLLQGEEVNGFLPPGRPKKWRSKALEILKESVEARVESDICESREVDKMWLVRHLEIVRKTIVDDLLVAKYLCVYSFPPSYNIFDRYVTWYHEALSLHLQNLIEMGLEGNETISLLRWLNEYTGKHMMGQPELKPLDVSKLAPLLDEKTNEELIARYFNTTRANLKSWTGKSLVTDEQDWSRDEEPDDDAEGYYRTSLPVIFFKMVHEVIEVAKTISPQLTRRVIQACCEEMNEFVRSYAEAMTSYKEEHFRDRQQPVFYHSYMIACVNNCETFISFAKKFEDEQQELMKDEVASPTSPPPPSTNPFATAVDVDNQEENVQFLLGFKHEMQRVGEVGCDFLLDEVFIDLKVHFDQLMKREWIDNDNDKVVETFCCTLEDYYNDYVHLRPTFIYYIMIEAERRVIVEYLHAILDRRIKCGGDNEREQLGERLLKDHVMLSSWFTRFGPTDSSRESCDVLSAIAEVIKLQDKSMMSLEVSGLVSKYNDVSVEQLQAILAIRGDFSTSEAKELAESAQEQQPEEGDQRAGKGIFSSSQLQGSRQRSGFFHRS